MSNTAYIGSGTTLSSKYYLRSFYRSNREAGTSSKRREFSGNQLALADGVDIELLYQNKHTINNLIEAAVNEMQSPMVVIDQNIGFEEAGTEDKV